VPVDLPDVHVLQRKIARGNDLERICVEVRAGIGKDFPNVIQSLDGVVKGCDSKRSGEFV
jgi:hypothetical protein